MEIQKIENNKKEFLDLLFLGDEQENMIDRYLERGEMFALYDGGLKTIAVVTGEGDGIFELKNIATYPHAQRQGYGRHMIAHLLAHFADRGTVMLVGTGEEPAILSFYQGCGFEISHRIENFFTDHYDQPIYENGVQLVDMVYLRHPLDGEES